MKSEISRPEPEGDNTSAVVLLIPEPPVEASAQKDSGRIPSLDGLRGVAILMVLFSHAAYSLPEVVSPAIVFAGNGNLGVNIFFMLSGYLIYRLSVREYTRNGGFQWRQFYLRRILRIFPCFYFYILVVLGLMGLGAIKLTWPVIVSASTFTVNYRHLWDTTIVNAADYHVIEHYWTLSLEEQFYLTWPLLMLLFARRKLLPVLGVVLVLAPILRVITYFLMPASRGQVNMMFHTGFDAIAAGVLLGELLRRQRPKAWLERLAGNKWILGAAIVIPFIVSPLLKARFGGSYHITVGKSLELACLGIVITAAVFRPGEILFRFLNWPPLGYIGVLSYSLYVWNDLFLNGGMYWTVNAFPLNIACVFATGLLSYYFVETPFLRLKDRFHKPAPSSG